MKAKHSIPSMSAEQTRKQYEIQNIQTSVIECILEMDRILLNSIFRGGSDAMILSFRQIFQFSLFVCYRQLSNVHVHWPVLNPCVQPNISRGIEFCGFGCFQGHLNHTLILFSCCLFQIVLSLFRFLYLKYTIFTRCHMLYLQWRRK